MKVDTCKRQIPLPDMKGAIRTFCRAIALSRLVASAFIPLGVRRSSGTAHSPLPLCRLSSSSPPPSNQSNQTDNNNISSKGENTSSEIGANQTKNYSVARAGGRRPRTTKSKNPERNGFIAAVRQLALPLLTLTFILRSILWILGGGSNDPNVVYYSRSVYQSTTYTRDGNVETTRRENFQSNIPELINQSQRKSSNEGGIDSSSRFFDIIEKDMEDEIDSLLYQKW